MVNVCVLGAAGGIGQPLSLLLKQNLPRRSNLYLYDLAGTAGVAADLSHVDSDVNVFFEQGQLPPVANCPALAKISRNIDVFVIVAGVPRKPGMTRDDLFNMNAIVALNSVRVCATASPNAVFCIVTNPVNSTVPIAAQVLMKMGIYNKNKLFGVSALDGMRATRFVNEARAPLSVRWVPVVGGHSDTTIVPLLSQVPGPALPADKARAIFERVRQAGTEVVQAKAGRGSATLSMAAAGARFALQVVAGLTGAGNPVVYAFVDTDGTVPGATFLAIPVMLGQQGIVQRLPIGAMSKAEQDKFGEAVKLVNANIETGVRFAKSKL